MIISLLFRLATAHLLTDFVFQPASWVEDRKLRKIRSVKLFWHILFTTALAWLFSGLYLVWWIPLTIFLTHYLIDLIKAYLPDSFRYFLADQLAHLSVLAAIWIIADRQLTPLISTVTRVVNNPNFWILSFSYVLVTWPLGILIGKATAQWRNEIGNAGESMDSLANAGKWIGICERILILTFVLTNQFTAIGFLVAAKSILRFGDKNAQRKTEYILVGTLMSFAASCLLGVILTFTLK